MKKPECTAWTVDMTSKARKQAGKLPEDIVDALLALWADLKTCGPVQPAWPHYGKLKGRKEEEFHCHLNKGRPTYVVVWKVLDKQIKLMEINYVGTHENAPY
jgi:mRNA-degrading endonuclease RelE of RelBE toxin-antitoxin system